MKNITIAGNVTKDSELRSAGAGQVLGFSVAVSQGYGDKKTTLYFDCSLWGNRGAKLQDFITKGSKIVVTGDFGTREYDGKTYLTLNASDVTLIGGKPSNEYDQSPASESKVPFNDDLPPF